MGADKVTAPIANITSSPTVFLLFVRNQVRDWRAHFPSCPSTPQLWGAVFVVFALLYVATAQRGVSWQDSGTFQWRILQAKYTWDLYGEGLATFHPLYILVGQIAKMIPVGSFPHRVNALSGVGMAITLANLACALRSTTKQWGVSALTVSILGVSHVAWFLSTIAEVYTWSAALFSAELWLLLRLFDGPRRRDLFLLAGVNALGLSVHNFALLPLPIYVGTAFWLWRRNRLSRADLGWAAGAYLIGAFPYFCLIGWAVPKLGGLLPAVKSALVGRWGGDVLNTSISWPLASVNYALGSLSFANLIPILAVIGGTHLLRHRRPLGMALGGIAGLHFAFVARYSVPDMFTFLLPTLVVGTVLAGIGARALLTRFQEWQSWIVGALIASILLPPIGYGVAPTVLNTLDVDLERSRTLPYRHEARYWLVPWKHNEQSAQRFAEAALIQTQTGDLIIADSTPYHPLQLAKHLSHSDSGPQIERAGTVSPGTVQGVVQEGTVYVVSPVPSYAPSWLLEAGSFRKEGVLHRLTTVSLSE